MSRNSAASDQCGRENLIAQRCQLMHLSKMQMTTDQANNNPPVVSSPGGFPNPSGDKSQHDGYVRCWQAHGQRNNDFWDSRVVNVDKLVV